MAERADRAGLRRLHLFAFRDLDDPEAGGSEAHASQVARHLVAAGREVVLHTGRVQGGARGDRARRRARGAPRRAARACSPPPSLDERLGRLGPADGIIEIFHGVPFFAPLWSRLPQVGVVHHVHLGTWDMLLPRPFHHVGHAVERHLVPARLPPPHAAHRRAVGTRRDRRALPASTPTAIAIAPHGIDDRFTPGRRRAPTAARRRRRPPDAAEGHQRPAAAPWSAPDRRCPTSRR